MEGVGHVGRNHKKEAEWKKTVYSQVNFQVKKELAAEYRAHLAEHGISAVEWFKYAVSLMLIPGTSDTHMSMGIAPVAMIDGKIPAFESSKSEVRCARCGTPCAGYVDGYFKCLECEFGNYEPTGEEIECNSEHDDDGKPLAAELDNTHMSIDVQLELTDAEPGKAMETQVEITEILPETVKPKKRRTISPTVEMVEEWRKMYESGMSFGQIASTTQGYDASTIRKRVKGRGGTAAN